MLFRSVLLLTIISWFSVQSYVAVPSIYRKAEVALQHYSSHTDHNPVIFSLLNVLTYDKRAKAFTTNEAVEKSLKDVKKFNEDDAKILRRIIYGRKKFVKPSLELKEDVQSALDTFFSNANMDDHQTFDMLFKNQKF